MAVRTKKKSAAGAKQDSPVLISLPAMNMKRVEITLIGDSSLICHNWSDRAKKQILDKQMKRATAGREAKDPEQDYRESLYFKDGCYVFPAIAFKKAAVDSCSQLDGITKVLARGAFHVLGDFVKIQGTPSPREDMVRVGMGSADIRYRGEFLQWSAKLHVRYNANVLSAEQIVNLFNVAGFGVGIGNWRPEKNGNHGLFHVATGGESK